MCVYSEYVICYSIILMLFTILMFSKERIYSSSTFLYVRARVCLCMMQSLSKIITLYNYCYHSEHGYVVRCMLYCNILLFSVS